MSLLVVSGGLCEGFSAPAVASLLRSNISTDSEHPTSLTLQQDEASLFSSLIMAGMFMGALPGGIFLAWGRKTALILAQFPRVMGWVIIFTASTPASLYVGRFLTGFSIGAISVVIPVYLTEISHPHIRGTLTSILMVALNAGILINFIVGKYYEWKDLAMFSLITSVACALPVIAIFESPVYLVSRGRHLEAREILQKLRGSEYNVDSEMEAIQLTFSQQVNKKSVWEIFTSKKVRNPLMILCTLIVIGRLCGYYAIISFLVTVFKMAGVTINENTCSIMVGILQVIAAIVTCVMIDSVGRRILLIVSLTLMALSLISLAVFMYIRNLWTTEWDMNHNWVPLLTIMIYVVSYSLGMGDLLLILTGEFLPASCRLVATGIVGCLSAFTSFITTQTFMYMVDAITFNGTIIVYACICLWGVLFVCSSVPETKGLKFDILYDRLYDIDNTEEHFENKSDRKIDQETSFGTFPPLMR